jgi:hypothetical protein
MTNLTALFLAGNQLTNLVLPPDLGRLEFLNVGGNHLASLNLPLGLTNLTGLFVVANLLTNLTLPPDMTRLTELSFLGNPLTIFVLSEPLAASTNLIVNFVTIASLRDQGFSVFTYPLVAQLVQPLLLDGSFKFEITGPPGVYSILASPDLSVWIDLGTVTNQLGNARFNDQTASASSRKFYRARAIPQPDR